MRGCVRCALPQHVKPQWQAWPVCAHGQSESKREGGMPVQDYAGRVAELLFDLPGAAQPIRAPDHLVCEAFSRSTFHGIKGCVVQQLFDPPGAAQSIHAHSSRKIISCDRLLHKATDRRPYHCVCRRNVLSQRPTAAILRCSPQFIGGAQSTHTLTINSQ